ncbi:dolichyl-phosphate beta-glucosyltransferase [Copidosoma floridanum]|uniref:dolichyl-phosphate beta-glucosyltransferase n=1 Tax=Copidosoma floridanum TaxID=29053 RepID=UPI0006C9403E|nr:dolichyl-phosphate beta-glucosyltransferase [Copidosoma floridanum]
MSFETYWFYLSASLLVLVILCATVIYVMCKYTDVYPKVVRCEEEKFFLDPASGTKRTFPSLADDWSINLSVIVPAYNEETRLPSMLDECLNYLEERKKSGLLYEIIIVSDGSTDKTVDVAHSYAKKYSCIRVLALVKNRGKGGAVRLGMQSARGSVLLFADADGATTFSDLTKLDESLRNVLGFDYVSSPGETASAHAIICGSRAHLEEEEKAKRSLFRLLLMHGFHFLVWFFCVKGVHDTQCGFKLLTRESARLVFAALHVERWAFDVEMLYIAEVLGLPVTEVAVEWQEIEGSKIVPVWSWLQMGRDLMLISLRYKLGAWKILKPKTS